MRNIALSLAAVTGFLVLQSGEVKADHRFGDNYGVYGRSASPTYQRELLQSRAHQFPMSGHQHQQLHDDLSYGAYDWQNGGRFNDCNPVYRNPRSNYDLYYSTPSMRFNDNWDLRLTIPSRPLNRGGAYRW